MKLIRFTTAESPTPCFGIVIRDRAVPFAVLQGKAGKSSPHLTDSRSYLANLPDSERAAKDLAAWGEQHFGERCLFWLGEQTCQAGELDDDRRRF